MDLQPGCSGNRTSGATFFNLICLHFYANYTRAPLEIIFAVFPASFINYSNVGCGSICTRTPNCTIFALSKNATSSNCTFYQEESIFFVDADGVPAFVANGTPPGMIFMTGMSSRKIYRHKNVFPNFITVIFQPIFVLARRQCRWVSATRSLSPRCSAPWGSTQQI